MRTLWYFLEHTLCVLIDPAGPVAISQHFGSVLSYLPLWDQGFCEKYSPHLDASLWTNHDFVLAWVKTGGSVHDRRIPQHFQNDDETMLAAAETVFRTYTVRGIPDNRKSDKAIMKRYLATNPKLLSQVAPALKGDMDLALAAIGQKDGALVYAN